MIELESAGVPVIYSEMEGQRNLSWLLGEIDSYYDMGGPFGRSESKIISSMEAFLSGDPLKKLEIIRGSISLLDQAIDDPEDAPAAIVGLYSLATGPTFDGGKLASEVVRRHLSSLGAFVGDEVNYQSQLSLGLLIMAAGKNPEIWKVIKSKASIVLNHVLVENPTVFAELNFVALQGAALYAKRDTGIWVMNGFVNAFKEGRIERENFQSILGMLARGDDEYSQLIIADALIELVQSYGLDPHSVAGTDSPLIGKDHLLSPADITNWSRENLEVLQDLENQRPGIVKFLHDRFGIRHFSRYPVKMLISQFDQFDQAGPYGIILVAENDHNNSFLGKDREGQETASAQVWENLASSFGGQYPVRIVEAEDALEVINKVRFLKNKYGPHNGGFLYFTFHGNHGRISFGRKSIRRGQISEKTIQVMTSVLHPNAEVILDGCLTARRKAGKDGIAVKLANSGKRTVFASTGLVTDIQLSVLDKSHPPKFNVIFDSSRSTRKIEPTKTTPNQNNSEVSLL